MEIADLFVCLFNDSDISLDCNSTGLCVWCVSNELERLWKDAVEAYLEAPSHHFRRGFEEKN